MTTLLLLCLLAAGHHAKPAPDVWSAFNTQAHVIASTTPASGDIATIQFPTGQVGSGQLAFIATTREVSLLGDLTGHTITATFSISTTGTPRFTYWGEGSNWNTGPMPANCRLVFMTRTGFSTAWADEVWYSNPVDVALAGLGSAPLSNSLTDPSLWSNGQGQQGSNRPAQFNAAVANVAQVGLAFGGGSFFDVGVNVIKNTGSAIFHLESYID